MGALSSLTEKRVFVQDLNFHCGQYDDVESLYYASRLQKRRTFNRLCPS